jgi:uncharacterized protein
MLVLIGIGCLTGFMITLTGSGGILAMPLLLMLTHLPQQQMLTTALIGVFTTSLFGLLHKFYYQLMPNWTVATILILCGCIGSPIGAYLSLLLTKKWLSAIISLLLAGVILTNLTQAKTCKTGQSNQKNINNKCMLGLYGLLIGLLSSMLGIGGGFLIVPLLLYGQNLTMQQTTSTSLIVLLCMSVFGTYWHLQYISINPTLIELFLLGGICGAFIGTWSNKKMAASTILLFFNLMLCCVLAAEVYTQVLRPFISA